jgi:hypothetical protein
VTNLIVRRCRRRTSQSYYTPLPGSDQAASLNQYGYVPVSKYDIGQLVISFFHLGFVGFLFGWRMDEYDGSGDGGGAVLIGAIGQFVAWVSTFLK